MLLTIVVFATLLPTFHLGVRKVIHANQLAILASNRAQLITFTFTPQQYEKLSIDNNELEYNNKMYDIKSSVTTNTNTILTLLPDSRETYVIALFKHLTSRNKVQLTACNLFLFYYYEGIPVIQLKPIITTRISRNYIAHVYFYVNPLHKNTTPPPQLLS
ncbi:MAG: hypothetical protein H7331_12490 [Bacteroidia bacterium]|nr:hypothetical protein [Bacteroidia bacterium]